VVFIAVQNLVGIGTVVLIILMFFLISLVWLEKPIHVPEVEVLGI